MTKKKNNWFSENIDDDIAKTLINLKVTLSNGKVVSRDFTPEIGIDYDLLEEELEKTPSVFAFWSLVLAEQKAAVMVIERNIAAKKADVLKLIKEEEKAHEINFTRKDIEDVLKGDDRLKSLDNMLIMAKKRESKLFAIVKSLEMKSEHIRSLAGFKRQEMRQP